MDNLKLWLSFWFKCVTTDFLNFKGRSTRREFVVFMLVTCVLSCFCGFVALWALIPLFAIASRRLNDTGRSLYHHLLLLVPFFGSYVWLYLVAVEPSLEEANEHGPKPESQC